MSFEYTVRESARAKHVRFRVSVQEGLVVVIPEGFKRSRIPKLIEQRKSWIRQALAEVAGLRNRMADPSERPDQIELKAVDEVWHMEWNPGAPFMERQAGVLVLAPETSWQSTLKRWLIRKAESVLIPEAARLADRLGVRVDRISIRCQKTRWGSYSTRRTVSLNAQLLFLRKPLVRYVLLHELCHAWHPNHSSAFWRELERWEPDAQRLRAELRDAWRLVPFWLSATVSPPKEKE